jgi:hypothetical protein
MIHLRMKITLFLWIVSIGKLAGTGPVALRGTMADPTSTPLHGATVTLKSLSGTIVKDGSLIRGVDAERWTKQCG